MRFLSWVFLVLTVIVVVLDWLARGESGEMVLRPLTELWGGLDASSLATVRTEIANASPEAATSVLQPLLDFPAALSTGIAFLFFRILGSLFRSPKRPYNDEPV